MNMSIKPGAKILGMTQQALTGWAICAGVYEDFKLGECVLTCGTDDKHKPGSLHFAGQAFDLRIRDIPPASREPARTEMKRRLGDDFDVVLEGDHFHVEYQPKVGYSGTT